MIRKKWVSDNSSLDLIKELSEKTDIDESIIRILVNRNIKSKEKIEEFLNPSLDNLYDPYLLNDLKEAVERINKAIENNEKICIYGDYDVDGVTASSLLYMSLKSKTDNIYVYIPHREEEGYGLNIGAIDKIKNIGANLIITVDCGITSIKEAEYAKENGIDMIITDHHTCPDVLPSCIAVINPKRKDSTYPFSELCGAGVSLKLCSALGVFDEKILAIAAIGTVADIVPLVSENRIITHYGIKALKKGVLPNINILLETEGIKKEDINASTLGFVIAPRINAAGRMESAKGASEFFITEDKKRMEELAHFLDNLNKLRQECEKEIYKEAKDIIEKNEEYLKDALVIWGKGWQEGVIGIVASRITEEYHKPCVLISVNEGIGKGSSRSIKGFNIYDALDYCKESLIKFGGHALAAGLSLEEEKLNDFKEEFLKYAKEIFKNGPIYPELMLDCELKEENIDFEYIEKIKKLEPFGMGNPEPVFLIKSASVKNSFSFCEDKHMRLKLKKGSKDVEAVGFGMGSFASSLKENSSIHIAAGIGINEYRGIKKIQVKIKDIRLEK